jgi:N-methylhydantoinase B/oxoprolinase/acetone carboxylase alpha subunit
MGDRQKSAPWGLQGGGEAAKASLKINRAGRDQWQSATEDSHKISPSKFAGMTLNPGDRIRLTTAGGGGWGDPAGRDVSSIAADIDEGWVSAEQAQSDYHYHYRATDDGGGD